MIKHISFKHGWFYHYRVHLEKLSTAADLFPSLQSYLLDMFENCPDELFSQGPRGSKLQLPVDLDIHHVPGHTVCSAARFGLDNGRFKTAHSNVQVTMLENDSKTLAVEVPLYMQADEAAWYEEVLGTDGPLTGHIDVLTLEQDTIWVWDYKPDAAKEKWAHVQTLLYAIMLSVRTGIDLQHFRCGYFDDQDCYLFEPTLEALPLIAR